MPQLSLSICRHPGCGQRIEGGRGYCEAHACAHEKATPWGNHHTKRTILGKELQRTRRALFAREPLCAECLKVGRTALAVIRDHIIPLSQGGLDVESNTQGLCKACHDVKSEGERKAGFMQANQNYRDRLHGVERERTYPNRPEPPTEVCLA